MGVCEVLKKGFDENCDYQLGCRDWLNETNGKCPLEAVSVNE